MVHIQRLLQTVETLPAELQQEVADFAEFLAQRHVRAASLPATSEQIAAARKAGFGALRGRIRMADDFDEPLEDLKDYR